MSKRKGPPPGSEPSVFPTEQDSIAPAEDMELSLSNSLSTAVSGNIENSMILNTLSETAYSVVRSGDKYQLIKILFNSELKLTGEPQVVLESGDRWEVQSQYEFISAQTFLEVDGL